MSVALAAPPSSPTHDVLARLAHLQAELARPDLELAQALAVRDQAALLHAYAHEANLAADVAYEALEAKLRAERRCGALLEREQSQPARPPWHSRTRSERRTLPAARPSHRSSACPARQASRWRMIACLSDDEFEARLRACRAAGRELSTTALARAAAPARADLRADQARRP